MKALGIANPQSFDYLDPPPYDALHRAFELLLGLGALKVCYFLLLLFFFFEKNNRFTIESIYLRIILDFVFSHQMAHLLQSDKK